MRYTITFSDGTSFVLESWAFNNEILIEAIENWLKETLPFWMMDTK